MIQCGERLWGEGCWNKSFTIRSEAVASRLEAIAIRLNY